MSMALPTVISDYLAASDRGDLDALVACFTDDAVVLDEDQGVGAVRPGSASGGRRWPTPTSTRSRYAARPRRDRSTASNSRRPHPSRGQLPRRHRRSDLPLRAAQRPHRHTADRADGDGSVVTDTGVQLGQIGAWFNPRSDDDTRTGFVIQAEKLGYPTAWLGGGRASISDLSLVERVLNETATITVATAIVNMWTNDPADIAESYQRIAARHGDRFLLGIGIGHPESITTYRQPYATMVDYLDQLDAGGVPRDRRILAALGPRASAGGRPHARDPPVPRRPRPHAPGPPASRTRRGHRP